MAYQPGPKELAVKALRERRAEERSKPSTSDLRNRIEEIKQKPPKPKKKAKAKKGARK